MKDEKKAPKLRFKGFTDDWEQCKLGDVFVESTEKSKDDNEELLSVTLKDGVIKAKSLDRKNNASFDKKNYKLVIPNDIAYNSMRMWQGALGVSKYRGIVSPAYTVIKLRNQLENPYFYQYYFKKSETLNLFRKNSQGLTSDTWNLKYPLFSRIHFFTTSIEEQQKISSLLNLLDRTITLHEEKKRQLERLKSALLQKMFADKSGYPAVRFKGFNETWKQQKFHDVVDGLQNNTLSRSDLSYDCGSVKNIHYGDILTKFGEFIDASKTSLPYISDNAKTDRFRNSFLKDGDVVITDTAEDDTVGKCIEIQGSENLKILAGLHTIACRPKQKYGPKYLGYYLNSPTYHNQLRPLMQGIKVTSISKSALQNTDIQMPKSIAEQTKIGDIFSNLDSLISIIQREIKGLNTIKQSLLQKMFI